MGLYDSSLDRNQALVYIANEAEDSIDSGYYVLLIKKNEIWTVWNVCLECL